MRRKSLAERKMRLLKRSSLVFLLTIAASLFAQSAGTKLLGNAEEGQLFELLGKNDIDGAKTLLHTLQQAGYDISPALGAVFGKGDEYYYKNDYRASIPFYQLGVDFHDPRAEATLGFMYANGKGVFLDRAKAAKLYEESAAQEDPDGLANLATAIEDRYPGTQYSLERVLELYRKSVAVGPGSTGGRLAAERLKALGSFTEIERKSSDATTFEWDPSVPSSVRTANLLRLNGVDIHSDALTPNSTSFLGDSPKTGLNIVENGKAVFLIWREEHKLSVFENPYANSFAVIVAIDDYERKNDPRRRGPTGFGQLGSMVTNAEQLKKALVLQGFTPEKILTFYNQQAESGALNEVLRSFWQGGNRSSADRLFFYFGGHGSNIGRKGLLITYDYDPKTPTLTSILMHDLTGQQSENLVVKHVFIALDACDSGLALPTLGDGFRDASELKNFRSLSIIRNDTAPMSRNILVAGTGDQPAVYDNGGVFTQALVRGLEGQADENGDGIIEASELATFVKDEVAFQASKQGVVQQVRFYMLTAYGTGEVIFIKKP
jgi:hypothetical protein